MMIPAPKSAWRRRSGRIILLLLVTLTLMITAFAVAVNVYLLWDYREEMQCAGDSAADAAVGSLIGDDLLRGDSSAMPALLDNARDTAISFAAKNNVQGRPFVLHANPDNHPFGDILFGTLDTPRGSQLVLPGDTHDPTNVALPAINTVRILAKRTRERGNAPGLLFGQFTGVFNAEIRTQSAAMLDRDVIGFHPTDNPLILAPFALFSDPTGADPRSWDYQIVGKNAPDSFRFDAPSQSFMAGSDGLGEFPASLATDPSQIGTTNVAMLTLGITTMTDRVNQLQNGITAAQLSNFGGQLVLGPTDNRLTVPGSELGPAVGSSDLNLLYSALTQLQAAAAIRIWPLYSGTDGSGNPILCGFVAGRVVTVVMPVVDEPLQFSIQPTMTSVGSAVTDATRRGVGGIAVVNPYICKVRFVE